MMLTQEQMAVEILLGMAAVMVAGACFATRRYSFGVAWLLIMLFVVTARWDWWLICLMLFIAAAAAWAGAVECARQGHPNP